MPRFAVKQAANISVGVDMGAQSSPVAADPAGLPDRERRGAPVRGPPAGAASAGARSGKNCPNALVIQPATLFIVEVRAFTGAGSSGLTILLGGSINFMGLKHPPLVGILGSVIA